MSFESDNLVIRDLFEELERERAYATSLSADLETVSALLSEALALMQRQTTRLSDQAAQLRQLMGRSDIGWRWHPPIRLVDVPDVEIPSEMTRSTDIRWDSIDGKPPR